MTSLIVATALFLATHFITSTPLRPALVGVMGEWPYRGAYSLVALLTLIWITRHPIMWGLMLWAASHIVARGDLKSLVFFGGLLSMAGVGTLLMDHRKKSNPDWQRFAAVSSNVPFVAVARGRNRIRWREIGWIRPAAGLAVFFGVLLFHP